LPIDYCDGDCVDPWNFTPLGLAVASLSALVLALRAAQIRTKGSVIGVTWAGALLLAFIATHASRKGYPWLAVLQVSTLTCTMFFSAWPWTWSWCALPALWALLAASLGHNSHARTAAGAVGLLLLAFVWHRRLRHDPPGSEQPLAFPVELAGIVWVMFGAAQGPNELGHFGQICAITALIALGAAELVVGLSISRQDLWRRISGLLCIILAICLCASAAEGLVQGVITLVGSVIAIALAVLVGYAQQDDQTDLGNDASVRMVEMQGPGEGT